MRRHCLQLYTWRRVTTVYVIQASALGGMKEGLVACAAHLHGIPAPLVTDFSKAPTETDQLLSHAWQVYFKKTWACAAFQATFEVAVESFLEVQQLVLRTYLWILGLPAQVYRLEEQR